MFETNVIDSEEGIDKYQLLSILAMFTHNHASEGFIV